MFRDAFAAGFRRSPSYFQSHGRFVPQIFTISTQKKETGEGAIVLTDEAGFEAIEEMEAPGVVGEVTEGEAGDGGGREGQAVGTDAEAVFLMGEVGAFDVPKTPQTPAADGHIFNEVAFDLGDGQELVPHGFSESGEPDRGFAIEGDSTGEQAVVNGVAGGGRAALLFAAVFFAVLFFAVLFGAVLFGAAGGIFCGHICGLRVARGEIATEAGAGGRFFVFIGLGGGFY